ncbi:universal stress protein [Gudongella oleilytica]|jgi:nucleotide-binding universal stress UspA family protein|uniref:universal stress protein n=1 Tax=Gudongella oleilytica TaxID=1582259 RepID=UPI000EC6D901|nr:universal stress protein [Gudongella oleilytica]MDY0255828.1 universal stress protein [Gudongella oleilytica]HCO18509.1 universal stress protein [Tissierellales bacterium]HMM70241.1 universal stress protein [Gudongella oleilytica]
MKKILVPIDGSEWSTRALLKAREIAEAFLADVTILTVIDSIRYLDMDYKFDVVRDGIDLSKQLLEQSKKMFEGYAGNVDTAHIIGDVAEEIIRYAENGSYDLIVMGSRGLGVFSRTILGSVSHKVIQHAKTTVMIVK